MYEMFAAKTDERLNQTQRLIVVDMEARMLNVIREKDPEGAMTWFLIDLVGFTVKQADFECRAEGLTNPDASDAQAYSNRLITLAQFIWDEIVNYLKDTAEIEVHPLAMLQILMANYLDQKETPVTKVMKTAIYHQVETMYKDIPNEFEAVEVPNIPEILECNDAEKLIKDFFQLLSDIGTFHRDRDVYENDDQRKLHDRIIATYHRLGELNI